MPSILSKNDSLRSRLLALCLILLPVAAPAAPLLHHALSVELDPPRRALRVTDRLSWPTPPQQPLEFILHAGLAPRVDGAARIVRLDGGSHAVPVERYRLELPAGARAVTLHYGGVIHHPLADHGEGPGQGRQVTPGLIGPEGVVLGAASAWYPWFAAEPRHSFELSVQLPPGWEAVSQGARDQADGQVRWREDTPQEEIHLIAGPFTVYRRGTRPEAMVYLRKPDAALAERYLAATTRYLTLYGELLGAYPYAKFALVENFWETGYGMPSFTLLGPRVIRLPFLLESSYPHEILHNWWGNGVYIDAAQGNWAEGLTAYLADHLLQEQAGRGSAYRRDQLQAYAAYVSEARDLPLTKFRERHSGASQAIGYGKALMFYHMLRRELGDEVFLAGLRRFYRDARFRPARVDDLRVAFEAESRGDLRALFDQWFGRTGAPRLELAGVAAGPDHLTLTLTQAQPEPPFRLRVPVFVQLTDGRWLRYALAMDRTRVTNRLALPAAPACVAVDPHFDLFRHLLPGEQPASISAVLGAERPLILLPAQAPAPLYRAWRELATAWRVGPHGAEIRNDGEFATLPAGRPVLLLGWQNRHRNALPLIADEPVEQLMLDGRSWPRAGHGFVMTTQHDGRVLAWVGTDSPAAVPALARKIPHYGKYSYLVFEGDASDNRAKGQWPVQDSPLTHRFGAAACTPPSPPPLTR